MAKKILLVDDEIEIVAGIEAALTAAGYAVVTALDGETALATARAEVPDLIILDLLLPKVDGWRVCQQLRNDPRFRRVPVIMLSALHQEESGPDAVSLGDALFPKPCATPRLLAKVRELLTTTETTRRA